MSFLIPCPNCGNRSVYEYRFGGELKQRPQATAPDALWHEYSFNKVNRAGEQTEWWFHRSGCKQWIQASRNTVTNEVRKTWIAGEDPA